MKPYRQFLWIFFLFVPLLWLVWPSADKAGREAETPLGLGSGKQTPDASPRVRDSEGAAEARSGLLPRRERDRPGLGDSAGVDRILANDGISHKQAALQLREMAMDRTRPTDQRLEALEHGLNLGIDSFAGFAEQADLPAELASHYLHEIINYNDAPVTQIRTYIALIGHPDAEVSALAKEMLALEVGDENQEAGQEKLIQLGRRKLDEPDKDSAK